MAIIMRGIARKKSGELAPESHDRLLLAIAQSAAQLVTATSARVAMPGALETIGKALQADRVLVIENIRPGDTVRPVALVGIWQRADVPMKVDAEFFLDPVVTSPEIGDWLKPLAKGETALASVAGAPGAVARLLEAIQTKSILFVPIVVEGKWWGIVSIDDCKLDRTWSTAETDTLKIFAGIVGASIMGERRLTDLKQAEHGLLKANEALRESERKFHSVFQQTFQLMGIVATDGTLIDANLRALEFAGDKAIEVFGKPFWETAWWSHTPGLQAKLRDAIARAANGELVRFEVARPAADGSIGYVDFSLKPARDESGTVVFLIAEGYDISQRKRDEELLRESEEKFRSLTASAQDAIVTLDDSGRILFWNEAAHRTFGYSAEETLGQDSHALLAPARYLDAHRAGWSRFATDGQGPVVGKVLNLDARHKDGTEFPIELSVSAVRLRGHWHAIGIARDISERKRAERAMQRLNRTLRTLSAGNAALVRADREHELLDQMCNVIVELGGYRMAWIGMAEHDKGQTVRPVAWAGHNAGYVETAKLSWADTERGRGPGGTAIRAGVPQIVQNAMEPRFAPWRADALAHGYLSTAAFPLKDASGTFGVLCIYAAEADAFTADEVVLLAELTDDLSYGICALRTRIEREVGIQRLQRAMESVVQALANMVERRDPYTAGHQLRAAKLAAAIARDMGLNNDRMHGIYLAGVIHDVGKIAVPAEILSKPGKLSSTEFALVKEHAQAGYDIVKDIEFPWPVGLTILQHHERLDGSGYPNGLKGETILLEAKILAVADVVEAMTSHRPYRPALGLDAALAEVENGKGRLYDPAAVDACIALFRRKGFNFQDS